MASMFYGSGLRLMECLRLRIKDIDFSAKHIIVRDGKGYKDHVTILPETIIPELEAHLVRVKALHDVFLQSGYGEVELPYAFQKSIQMRNMDGDGNMCFLQRIYQQTLELDHEGDIIYMKVCCNAQ